MKLRTTVIATIFLALILTASPLGYCYSNIMASKTTDDVSGYERMTRICISPGAQIDISGRAILGTGAVAGLGTFYVLFASSKAATVAPIPAAAVPAETELAEAVQVAIPEGVQAIEYTSEFINGVYQVNPVGTGIVGTDFFMPLKWNVLDGWTYEAADLYTAINFAAEEGAEEAAEGAIIMLPEVASVSSPLIISIGIAIGVTVVVILVTATCAYIWWSST